MQEVEIWLFEIAVLIIAAKLLEGISIRTGIPRVVFFTLLGVMISFIGFISNYILSEILGVFATLGIISLLFLAGLESSLKYFVRGLKHAGIVAIGGVLGALGFALLAIPLLNMTLYEAFLIGVVLAATSVSVTVSVFEELGKLDLPEATTIVEAAVVDDVIGLILLSFLSGTGSTVNPLVMFSIPFIAFIIWYSTAILASRYMDILLKKVLKIGAIKGIEAFSFSILLILAFIAEKIGLASILLAYAYGIGLATHRYFARKVEEYARMLSAIFAPLFFIYVGYRLDFEYLLSLDLFTIVYVVTVITVLGFLSKFIGCYIAARAVGYNHKSSLIIGIGMIPRSEVAMVAATAAYELELIASDLYAAYIVMILLTTILSPIILRRVVETM
ncbi:MAG: cation:proton antiporter [Thermoprotei archaeon]